MIVDRAFDVEGVLGAPKKSKQSDPRYRVVHLPDRTWELLDHYFPRAAVCLDDPGLAFSYHGHKLGSTFVAQRFQEGLANAGISTAGRRLTPHSLRFTYDTKMRALLPPDVLREYIGHRSEQMTDHYDRATQQPAVERFWDNERARS